jgi:hypothetical protein
MPCGQQLKVADAVARSNVTDFVFIITGFGTDYNAKECAAQQRLRPTTWFFDMAMHVMGKLVNT